MTFKSRKSMVELTFVAGFCVFTASAMTSTTTVAAMTAASERTTTTAPVTVPYSSSSITTQAPTTIHSIEHLNLWNYLPRDWSSMCTVDYANDPDVNVTIGCHIPVGDRPMWRLADLRAALAPLEASLGLEVSVILKCDDGGTVSLPYPMRAPGLVKLAVRNCRMKEKYADFMTPAQNLPDWLKWQELVNCTWVNRQRDIDHMRMNFANITAHYECGQDSTMVFYKNSNVRDEIEMTSPANASAVTSPIEDLSMEDIANLLAQAGLNPDNLTDEMMALLGQTKQPGALPPTEAASATTNIPPTTSTGTGAGLSNEAFETHLTIDNFVAKCSFINLEVQEESYIPISSRSHFEYMAKESQFPKLWLLNYTAFGITDIPPELREARRRFSKSKLGVIDISHNFVSQVGFIPGYPSSGINLTLILRYNNITRIDYQMFKAWALVPDFYIDFRYNPIDCDCDMKSLVLDLKNDSMWEGKALKYYHNEMWIVTCATPPYLSGRTIGSLNVVDLPCPVYRADLTPAMAGLAVVVVVLLISLLVAIRYRKEARILIYTRMNIVLPCGLPLRSGLSSAEKHYDAFVSYAHQDSDWVLNQLMKLEEPNRGTRACKLCIHQRDFIVGKPIIDNIIDCIAASRHTIIVLSKAFVMSKWAMEELQHAYRQSLEERRCHLVLAVLEEVPQSDMTPMLRRCTKTFTYIHVNEALFWDRLLYSIHVADALPSKKGTKSGEFYDDISPDVITPSPSNISSDVDKSGKDEVIALEDENRFDAEFRRAMFLESMRTMSVDTTCSTTSDTHNSPTPSQFNFERPLFNVTG